VTAMSTGIVAALCAVAASFALTLPRPTVLRLDQLLPRLQQAKGGARWRGVPHAIGWLRRTCVSLLSKRPRGVERRRRATIELCENFAAELTAGRSPAVALTHAATGLDPQVTAELAPVQAAARFGGDVALALDEVAGRPGAEGMRLLGACWRVGADRGGALTTVVEGVTILLRDEEAGRGELAAQLSGPRVSAYVLAVLPVVGVAMGAALGARPLAFLFGTPLGVACLLAAIVLDALGVWWIVRIARGAEGTT